MFTRKKSLFGVVIVLLVMVLSACGTSKEPTDQPSEDAGLANPASVYCEGLGYQSELDGTCVFPDGSECDQWDFLAGRCGQEYSYCVKQGYVLEAKEDSNIGTCIFPDGSSCLEMEYFEGKCGPGEE